MANRNIATIDPQAACLTLINVYDVEPENQEELTRALSEATEHLIRHQPGFVSVCLHRSLDGRRVVNYAQWASKEHFEDFMKRPGTQEQLKRFASLARSVAPALYQVSAVHARPRTAGGATR
ncbi:MULTISPECIES: antibiotic biosynthesis monooxygenase [unclassified Pigmentiphaga]|jgi:heme-degrading monooxygenase HmoA|uniref:antibiotic biosynthesis monooxygenase family protein n=1 Tax=unclassified Pigmentiphaga TaxID=2626614 RepID=UPI000B41D546|nr:MULTISPECIES: antibiotic biosynthesis monooxygenase family protein [unclassified Pigmentiphaga]OVZ65274.1 antibiotic biosynthesis monooxygenase [Pigmentiphaga sp. NML030171]